MKIETKEVDSLTINQRAKFKTWMAKVDSHIESKLGLSSADLPDCAYMNWHEDGVSPKHAAHMAIKYASE